MASSSGRNKSGSLAWQSAYDGVNGAPPLSGKVHDHLVRFVILSDTHGTEPAVPDGDVLLHSGDLTAMGTTIGVQQHLRWLSTLPHRHKYIIAGNHDHGLCSRDDWYARVGNTIHKRYGYELADTKAIKQAVKEWEASGHGAGAVHRYVEDERVTFDLGGRTWSLYGSPWTPEFGGWAWNYKRGQGAQDVYAALPPTDILLTHGPPHKLGGLDLIHDRVTNVGCEELTLKLERGDVRPLLHCCGHIHESRGVHLQQWEGTETAAQAPGSSEKYKDQREQHGPGSRHPETLVLNSAIVEFDAGHFLSAGSINYKIKHQPIVVDVDPHIALS